MLLVTDVQIDQPRGTLIDRRQSLKLVHGSLLRWHDHLRTVGDVVPSVDLTQTKWLHFLKHVYRSKTKILKASNQIAFFV